MKGGWHIHEYVHERPRPPRQQKAPTKFKLQCAATNDVENSCVVQNIHAVMPAMNLLCQLDSKLGLEISQINQLEESFLTLATAPRCTDGTFYASVYKIEQTVICRYIESGPYAGFGELKIRDMICNACGVQPEDILMLQVFSEKDISNRKSLAEERGLKWEDKTYGNVLTKNKSSVRNCLHRLETSDSILGVVAHTARHGYTGVKDKKSASDLW